VATSRPLDVYRSSLRRRRRPRDTINSTSTSTRIFPGKGTMASCVRFLEHRMTPWGFHVIFTNLFFLLRPIDGPKSFRIPPTWSPRAAHLARVLRLAGMTTEESSAPRINSAIMSHGGGNQPRHVSPLTVEVRGPPPSPGTHMKFPFRCHKRLYGRIHCVHGIVPMVGTWNLQSFDGSV